MIERRAQKAKELHGAVGLWLIYFFTWLDLWSHLIVVYVAWFFTAYIMLPYLAIHFAMAASRSSPTEAIKAPLTWLVPQGGSTLHTNECYTWVFCVVSYGLRACCWFVIVFTTGVRPPQGSSLDWGSKHWESGHACDGLPPWLRHPWWSSEATCPISAEQYNHCLESLPWWRAGWCNYAAANEGVSFEFWSFKYGDFVDKVGSLSACSPQFALLLAGMVWCLRRLFEDWWQVEKTGQVLPVDHAPREPPSKWSHAKVAKDICLFCFDILSDLNGIVTFIWTGNFQFAGFSGLIFALSFGQQLARGGFHAFRQEAAVSLSEGCLTDGLRRLTLTEKSVEAPLQLLVQFFSFLYVTFNDYAVISFSVSMLASLYSVADAAYQLMELNLLPELSSHKVSTSYLSVQTTSAEVQLGDGKDVAK